jgi:hypothetical protein
MNGVVRFMHGFQRFTVLSTRSAALNQWRAARRLSINGARRAVLASMARGAPS